MKNLTLSQVKTIRALRQRRERYARGCFWAEGERTLKALFRSNLEAEYGVVACADRSTTEPFPPGTPLYCCPERFVGRISATRSFPGAGAVMKLPRFLLEPPNANILVVLDRISDPGNLGTFFRTALWFGVRDFVLDERTADPFNEKAVRASMGAVGGVRIHRSGDIVRTLHAIRENGHVLIAADPRGKPVQSSGFPGKCALIFGNEAHGLAPSILALADHRICIPGGGPVDSLNVTVAGGIFLGAATGYASRDQKPLSSA